MSNTIPIVSAETGDLVAVGIAASLAHPGGNVTGSTLLFPELMAKRLELLKQAEPSMTSVGVLLRRDVVSTKNLLEVMGKSARALGVELRPIEIADPGEFESAFAAWNDEKTGAVVVPEQFLPQAAAIVTLAMKHRMATASQAEWAARGGLIGYGPDINAMFHRAAYFVDKILKGAKPGDIPIEQATKFITTVNLKTAKALGLNIPATLLAAADEVIE